MACNDHQERLYVSDWQKIEYFYEYPKNRADPPTVTSVNHDVLYLSKL